jgi:hypothetical protein
MLRLASHWPISMLVSSGLPCTMPATKPPAKASLFCQKLMAHLNHVHRIANPAPFVSQICELSIACTGNSTNSTSPFSLATAAMLGFVPCVMMTVLGRFVFFFGRFAIDFAIALISVVPRECDSA